jgi:hypothetical protein
MTFLCALLFTISVSGCATVTTGTSQSVTIDTNPTGAVCTLARNNETVAIINPTPGTVSVTKSMRDISVLCKKEGYLDGDAVLSSKLQAMTFGNILIGGVFGVLIDAGSGAMSRYQPVLAMTLVPKEFVSVDAREAFFETMKTECNTEYSRTIESISKSCTAEQTDNCASQIKAAEVAKEIRLAEIEKLHNSAITQNQ